MRYLILAIVFISSLASAELYRWVDDKGNVHFSDTPTKQAEKYTPPPLQTVPAWPASDFTSKPTTNKTKYKYKSISISSPTNDQVFNAAEKKLITVSIKIEPALNTAEGHVLAFYLDGQLHEKGSSTHYAFQNLPRGTHTVSATVLNNKGKKLKSSEPVSFHIQSHHR